MFGFKAKDKVRPALNEFAWQIEMRLRANDIKGKERWHSWPKKVLLSSILEEVVELAEAKDDNDCTERCCVIASYAMMIFDNIKRKENESTPRVS